MDTAIKGLDHVGIVVADMDKTLRFYREMLGFSLIARYDPKSPYQNEIAYLKFPGNTNAKLELYSMKQATSSEVSYERKVGMREIALTVADVRVELDRLRAAGAEVMTEPMTTVARDLPADSPVKRRTRAAVKAPDGVIIGLYQWE